MKLRRTACRVDLEGVRQVVFRASGLLVRPAPQMAGADLMTGGLAGTGFRDNPNLGDGNFLSIMSHSSISSRFQR